MKLRVKEPERNYRLQKVLRTGLFFSIVLLMFGSVFAQTSSFTYQGKLNDGGVPTGANYDMQFRLFDAVSAGNQFGSTLTFTNVPTIAGIFTVQLDFGSTVFNGGDRFIEISISPAGQNNFTTLAPRQKINSAPYSVKSSSATTADTSDDSLKLGGIAASQYVLTMDSRLSDARIPLPGSSDYVQNTNTSQAGVNFTIGGTGTANILNAATQFDLNGQRILSNSGTENLFVGIGAGINNTTGFGNSFFGQNAGLNNTTGIGNSFFGIDAGMSNTTANSNSFFGNGAGRLNTVGSFNAFFGPFAGNTNTTGSNNAFFGGISGAQNTTGGDNSFFGSNAGSSTTTGGRNTFFGSFAGFTNTNGNSNTFIGTSSGFSTFNATGDLNTLVGADTKLASGINNATAIGAGAIVNTSNTLVLGRPADTVNIPGILNVTGSIGANTFNAATQYDLGGSRILSNAGTDNLFMGIGAGAVNTGNENSFFGKNTGSNNTTGNQNAFFGKNSGMKNTTGNANAFFGNDTATNNTTGSGNSFFGGGAGLNNTTGNGNSFFGLLAGQNNTTGTNNTFIGNFTGVPNTATQVNNSTALGVGATVTTSNTIVIGTTSETTQVPGGFIARGNQAQGFNPALQVSSSQIGGSVIANNLYIRQFNELPSSSHLCWRVSNAGVPALVITNCSTPFSSSELKRDFQPFTGGLNIIRRLNPVSFKWKEGGAGDVGLNAEDVAEVAPELISRNEKGEIEEVKENGLNVVFINAIKEQQKQIEAQAEQIKQQQRQIESLKKLICESNPQAEICKGERR